MRKNPNNYFSFYKKLKSHDYNINFDGCIRLVSHRKFHEIYLPRSAPPPLFRNSVAIKNVLVTPSTD